MVNDAMILDVYLRGFWSKKKYDTTMSIHYLLLLLQQLINLIKIFTQWFQATSIVTKITEVGNHEMQRLSLFIF